MSTETQAPQEDTDTMPDSASAREEPAAKTTALLSGKMRIAIVASIITIGIAYFAIYTISEATVEYMSVDQVVEMSKPDQSSQTIGVLGKLVPDSYIKSPDGVTAYFRLKDQDGLRELPVQYAGEIGQVFFNDHSEIILNGQLESNGTFHAELLTVRCPSKYLTEQERQELESDPDAPPYQPDYYSDEPDA